MSVRDDIYLIPITVNEGRVGNIMQQKISRISGLDELDKQKALLQLMTKLAEAKVSVREEGTISADDLEKEIGL